MFETVLTRVLKAIFGGGSAIDIGAQLDALQSIQVEHRLGRSLNDFFLGSTGGPNATLGPTLTTKIDVDDFWDEDGFHVPAGYDNTRVFTRYTRRYPMLGIFTTLLDYTSPTIDASVGLTSDEHYNTSLRVVLLEWHGHISFCLMVVDLGADKLQLDSLLPVDYETVKHNYLIKMNKPSCELFIDGKLKAIWLLGLSEELPKWDDTLPYALGGYEYGVTAVAEYLAFLKVEDEHTPPEAITFPLRIKSTYVGATFHAGGTISHQEGDPLPPRQYLLYTENTSTKWNGLATAGVVQTSHPVPVWGYPMKTLVFQADAAGNLDIQVYAGGGWRSWVPGGITLVANQLEVYNLNGEVPIARCIYTPTNADTITIAEWYLGGE